jgi:hypothetical protein
MGELKAPIPEQFQGIAFRNFTDGPFRGRIGIIGRTAGLEGGVVCGALKERGVG